MLNFILFLFIGFVLDLLITIQFKAVYKGAAFSAAILTFIYLVLNLIVLKAILKDNNSLELIAYSIGSAVGSYVGVKLKSHASSTTKKDS